MSLLRFSCFFLLSRNHFICAETVRRRGLAREEGGTDKRPLEGARGDVGGRKGGIGGKVWGL